MSLFVRHGWPYQQLVCVRVVKIFLGPECADEMSLKLPLSADSLSQQPGDISGDIAFSLRQRNVLPKNVFLQIDKSADTTGNVQIFVGTITSIFCTHEEVKG